MEQGLFHRSYLLKGSLKSTLVVGMFLLFSSSIYGDDLEDFLNDAPLSSESVLIDLENEVGANFNVVDDLAKKKKTFDESLIITPKFKKARGVGKTEPFTAQVRQGSIVYDLETGKPFRFKKALVVKAQLVGIGANRVFILDRTGKKRYQTQAQNAVNIEQAVGLDPEINPLIVYTNKKHSGSFDHDIKFSHFFSYTVEAIRTNYYATIFRGERQSANANVLQAKSYFLTERFPVYVGFNISSRFGFWEDPVLGTLVWNGLFFGPSFMRTFWKKNDSRWNFHISAYKSIFHKSEKAPDNHSFSTLGAQAELEKEFDTSMGPVTLGVSYRWSQSSIKDSTEYLENEALKGQAVAFGAYLSYRFNWSYR